MTAKPQEILVALIENAIEEDRLDDARQGLAQARAQLGAQPVLDELAARVREVEALTRKPQADALIETGQTAVRRLDYRTALQSLRRAQQLAPSDPAIETLLRQTEQAAEKHERAVAHNQAAVETADRIDALLGRDALELARRALDDARAIYGGHAALRPVADRLGRALRDAAAREAETLLTQARQAAEKADWQATLAHAERALRLVPDDAPAKALVQQARQGQARDTADRLHREAISEAAADVERLLQGGAIARAEARLHDAFTHLGRQPQLEALATRLDQARAQHAADQRLDWAARRANEAAAAVHEADRLSLQGRHADALTQLQRARTLGSDDPALPSKIDAASRALARQQAERKRSEALELRATQIRGRMEALALDDAAEWLAQTVDDFGADEPLVATLGAQLERLRAAQALTASPGGSVDAAPERTLAAALDGQRALAAAYAWRQALGYPFRAAGTTLTLALAAALVLLDLLQVLGGSVFGVLRLALPLLALGLAPTIVRETTQGRNALTDLGPLLDRKQWAGDVLTYGTALLLIGTPLLALFAGRPWHGVPSAGSSLPFWLGAGLLVWLLAALAILAGGAAAVFGRGRAFALLTHLRALPVSYPQSLIVSNLALGLAAAWLLSRAVVTPMTPWFGVPLASALEAYALVALPHCMGVVIRSHRLELSTLYQTEARA